VHRSRIFGAVFVLLVIQSLCISLQVPVSNASFEDPPIDPNGFGVIPYLGGWIELDCDAVGSTNTGAFLNTPEGSPDRLVNADGLQLAFLGSQQGNGLLQVLEAGFQSGCVYRLTVGLGISWRFPPASEDRLSIGFYYQDEADLHLIASRAIGPQGLSSHTLVYFDLYLAASGGDPAIGKRMAIGIVSEGQPGGFWVIDDVRVERWFAVGLPIQNPSFELPVVDPAVSSRLAYVDAWNHLDPLDPDVGVMVLDHLPDPSDRQVCYLADRPGNGLWQAMDATFFPGCSYLLGGLVGVWGQHGPSQMDMAMELGLCADQGQGRLDVGSIRVHAKGLVPDTLTECVSLLATVTEDTAWAGHGIGITIRALGNGGGYWLVDQLRLLELMPQCVPVANGSFEEPAIDPCGFGVVPYVGNWTELDCDPIGSTNTGAFLNTLEGSPDRLANADGLQLAFLGSQQGNGLEQVLHARYELGCVYRLRVGVGISWRFPPSQQDRLDLALFYQDGTGRHDIAVRSIGPAGLTSTRLQEAVLYLPAVKQSDPWLDKPIGIAIRANGQAGGFWVLDDVQLGLSQVTDR